MKGRCELCKNPARAFCEADGARLCWDCDTKVHSANFLVAKHSRSLLCHVCPSPTVWQALGPKLPLTVSVCHACIDNCGSSTNTGSEKRETGEAAEEGEREYEEIEDEEYYSDGEETTEDEDEDDGDNQVVPWSSVLVQSPPFVATTSSSSTIIEEFSTLKKARDDVGLDSDDEIDSASSSFEALDGYNSNTMSFSKRPHKLQKMNGEPHSKVKLHNRGVTQSRLAGMMITSLRAISRKCDRSSAILAIRRMSRASEAL